MTVPEGQGRSREVLEQLLSEHDASAYKLPPLTPGTDIFEPIRKLVRQFGEAIDAFLRRMLRNSGGFQLSDRVLDMLVMAAWGLLFLVVAVALYRILRLLLPYSRKLAGARARVRPPEVPKDTLDSELTTAESSGEFGRALRIRWRLLLRRKVLSPALTPSELLTGSPIESPELSGALNAGMFDTLALSDRGGYDELIASVDELEGGKR